MADQVQNKSGQEQNKEQRQIRSAFGGVQRQAFLHPRITTIANQPLTNTLSETQGNHG
jgi:hypothetical protein